MTKPIQKPDVGWPDGEDAQNEYVLIGKTLGC